MSGGPDEALLAGFEVGEVLVGRFRILAAIGEGASAEVYRALDLESGSPVALKLMRTSIADDPEALERMRREGEILERLQHPAIVGIVALGAVGDGRLFIAMELLEGETLGARMRRGRLSVAELAPVVAGVAAGLTAAHELGIIHRDLKPENIFLTRAKGGAPGVKLLDFGVSKMTDMERLTQTGQVIGTPRYMAPEQLMAADDIDARVDVYALGVILYEALSGRAAFDAKNPSELLVSILHGKVEALKGQCPDLSKVLISHVSRAMACEAGDRFASVEELADAFLTEAGEARLEPESRAGVATSVLGGMEGALPAVSMKRPTFSTPAQEDQQDDQDERREPSSDRGEAARPLDSSGSRDESADGLPSLPLRSAGWATRILLIAIALAAGGVTAAAVIAARREPPSERPEAPAVIIEAPPEGAALPEEPPPAPSITEANPESTKAQPRRRRRSIRRRAPSMEEAASRVEPAPEEAPEPEPESDSPAALMRSARQAMRAGDSARCIELLDQALSSGAPSFALRMRGDCLRREGREAEALRSYQRFCRIAPDHPAISEVRALVDGLGGRCD